MLEITYNPHDNLVEFRRDSYVVIRFPYTDVWEAITWLTRHYNLVESNEGGIRRRAKCLEFMEQHIDKIDLS